MDKPMEIDEIRIDPSPFQLVERTSLHKVGRVGQDAEVILSLHLCNNLIEDRGMKKILYLFFFCSLKSSVYSPFKCRHFCGEQQS